MKKFIYVMISVLTLAVISISSCKKDDNPTPSTNAGNILQQGNWRITLYSEKGVDNLSHFSAYTFIFNNGIVSAANSNNVISGTYSTAVDDSQPKLVFIFPTTNSFDELNNDWHILEETSTKIRLEDVSGGNGGTDLLTFERN